MSLAAAITVAAQSRLPSAPARPFEVRSGREITDVIKGLEGKEGNQQFDVVGQKGVQMRVAVFHDEKRENDLFDACFEWGIHLGLRTSIGQGLGRARPNWHDLWIDQPRTLRELAGLGHVLSDPPRRICHWSPLLYSTAGSSTWSSPSAR